MKSLMTLKCSLRVKNTPNLECGLHIIVQFLEKLSPFVLSVVHSVLSFSKSWFLGIIYRSVQKDSFKNEVPKH